MGLHQTKNPLCCRRNNWQNEKATYRTEVSANHILDKGFLSKIYQNSHKLNILILEMAELLKKHPFFPRMTSKRSISKRKGVQHHQPSWKCKSKPHDHHQDNERWYVLVRIPRKEECCIYTTIEVEVGTATMENHKEVPPKFRITILSSKLHTWVYTPKK